MFTKLLNVDVDASTFPARRVPAILSGPSTIKLDVTAAMLMLGSVTTPGGFSSASPARFWAWVRYYAAIASTPDLRITAPFADLDPHQKTILSDDFGVALSTMWLFEQLGGIVDIVDGRRFLIQYASLVHMPPRSPTRKVGPEKCPDYVVLDATGKWHVLECKGTQTSMNFRNQQMGKNALRQKRGIQITGSARGEQLVTGAFLAEETSAGSSHLRVIDPPIRPLIELGEDHVKEAEISVRRLATSRALGLAGFHQAAEEVALPAEMEGAVANLYKRGEAERVSRPIADRQRAVREELKRPTQTRFKEQGVDFVGRQIQVEIPGDAFRGNTGRESVYVRQGVNAEVVKRVGASSKELMDVVDEVSAQMHKTQGMELERQDYAATLREGRLFCATVEFR